jgi:dTDP-4-amino-4,6-dideoxygalactose transaminase
MESRMGESSGQAKAARHEIPVLVPNLPTAAELIPYLHRIDASHWYSNYGPLWHEFRDRLTAYIETRTGVDGVQVAFTGNGTSAIELALRCRRLPERRYCMMPSFTFIASAHAVCNAGLEPFLVDVDEQGMTLTPAIAERALSLLPEPPAVVLVISAFGEPPDVRAWEMFEREHRIPVVFDAAAALVSLDDIGHQPLCVSLHATKVLGIGEGGAVISTDAALIEQITAMTGFGFLGTSRVATLRGGNYRISEYTAAIGLAALASLDRKIARLNEVVGCYRNSLHNSPVRLQEGVGERWVTMTLNVTIPRAQLDDALAQFEHAGVQWRRWWGLGCHTHPAFASLQALDLPVTRELAPRIIGVPCHTELDVQSIRTVCGCLLQSSVA